MTSPGARTARPTTCAGRSGDDAPMALAVMVAPMWVCNRRMVVAPRAISSSAIGGCPARWALAGPRRGGAS